MTNTTTLNMIYDDDQGNATLGDPISSTTAPDPSEGLRYYAGEAPQQSDAGNAQEGWQENAQAQQGQQKAQGLLGGRFKNQDELLRSYQSLEEKVSALSQQVEAAKAPLPEPPPFPDSPHEIFGEVVGKILEENNLDAQGMHDRFWRYGRLEPTDEAALERAGLEPGLITGYLGNLKAQQAAEAQRQQQEAQPQAKQLTQEQVTALQQKYGGKEAYEQMAKWAGSNLSDAEIDAFDRIRQSGDFGAVEFALNAVAARYQAARGTEGIMLGGKASAPEAAFTDTVQAMQAMSDPKYGTDLGYTQKVRRRFQGQIASTSGFATTAPSPASLAML